MLRRELIVQMVQGYGETAVRFVFVAALISWISFLAAFHKNRYRMRCGLLFLLSVFLTYADAVLFNFSFSRGSGLIAITSLILILLFLMGFILFLLILFYNGVVLLIREGLHFQNFLSLILIGHLIATPLIINYASVITGNSFLQILVGVNGILTVYLILAAVIYVTSSLLVILTPQISPVDYVIVLGCGLVDGDRITPLLMGRVDKGIALYRKDPRRTVMIMSGGQGKDETIPEALAMKNYAVSQGVEESHIRMEDLSTNTLENMKFSRKMIEAEGGKHVLAAYATNRFHQFRAGAYAYKCGLFIRGVGSRTKSYYELNAAVREYIAMLARDWKIHLAVLSLLLIPYLIAVIFWV